MVTKLIRKTKYALALALPLSFIIGCSSDDKDLPQVVADFTYFIDADTKEVTFTNTSSSADAYFWNLGDGNTTTQENPINIYDAAGDYDVSLIATNVSGGRDTIQQKLTIETTVDPDVFDDGLLTNGDFENGVDSWTGNAANVETNGGNSYNIANVETAGNAFDVNLSQVVEITQGATYTLSFDASSDKARTMLAGIGLNEAPFTNIVETVNLTTETQTFTYTLTATEFGSVNSRVIFDMGADTGTVVIDNVSLFSDNSGGDTTAPVITINGDAMMNLTVGDSFTDPGATATDDTDGDISANITIAGNVDTNTVGTYTLTYNVSDAAGNAATEVTRTVMVSDGGSFDDGLLTNGDFENGDASWTGNATNVQTEGGNSFNFANVETAGDAFVVNLSQVVEIKQGSTYKLSFEASSDRARTIIAGIGLNEDPWTNTVETVNLTTETQTFTYTFTASDFGSTNSRVLFDMGAEVGVVVIDNVSLVEEGSEGGDTTAPVITLNGDATMNLTIGDTFTDPGATANDDTDGDISSNISVTGTVDTATAGTYTLTYSVTDAAGNTGTATRTVNVTDGSGGNTGAPTTAAPIPATRDAADVISLFSDTYTDINVDTWSATWDDSDIEDVTVEGNATKKISFANFIGVDFQSGRFDATSMTHFHMDFWTNESNLEGKVFNSKFSQWGGGSGEVAGLELNINGGTSPALETGKWVSIDVPLTDFSNSSTRDDLVQFLITSNLGVVYVDNIYLYK